MVRQLLSLRRLAYGLGLEKKSGYYLPYAAAFCAYPLFLLFSSLEKGKKKALCLKGENTETLGLRARVKPVLRGQVVVLGFRV